MTARSLPDDVLTTNGSLGGVPTLDITTHGTRSDAVLLWFHGGWYTMGSPLTVAALSSDIARRTGAKVVSIEYRLAPERPYPAALQDARAAYRGLLDSGVNPQDVAMVGDSAGGGIVASTLASLAHDRLPQPAAAVLFSRWTDLTLSGESMTTKVGIDPAFIPEKVRVRVADYVGDADPADPAISPIFADLRGLLPLLPDASCLREAYTRCSRSIRHSSIVSRAAGIAFVFPPSLRAATGLSDETRAAPAAAASSSAASTPACWSFGWSPFRSRAPEPPKNMEAIVREMRASARCRDRRRAVRCSCRTQSRCLATCVFLPALATRHGGVAAGRSRRSSAGAGPVVGTALYADCARPVPGARHDRRRRDA